jgi:hypothetical protein
MKTILIASFVAVLAITAAAAPRILANMVSFTAIQKLVWFLLSYPHKVRGRAAGPVVTKVDELCAERDRLVGQCRIAKRA